MEGLEHLHKLDLVPVLNHSVNVALVLVMPDIRKLFYSFGLLYIIRFVRELL